ncbi:hypothetical protein AWT69_001897 [Pseudomonas putida]|nr:hypothetical protein AWT69_001897 [Pseudomonas putida]
MPVCADCLCDPSVPWQALYYGACRKMSGRMAKHSPPAVL